MFEHTGISCVSLFPLDNTLRLHFTGTADSLSFSLLDVANNSLCYLRPAEANPDLYRFFEDSQGYLVITRKEAAWN